MMPILRINRKSRSGEALAMMMPYQIKSNPRREQVRL
jgi:hypothetical protein